MVLISGQELVVPALPAAMQALSQGQLLVRAAHEGDVLSIEAILQTGVDVDTKNEYGENALMYASRAGHVAILDLLVKAGADVEAQDFYKQTALMHAAREGRVEILEALVAAGAKLEAKNEWGKTALMFAAEFEDGPAALQVLLNAGAMVDAKNKDGNTALMFAANVANVEALLQAGCDCESKDKYGRTALMLFGRDGVLDRFSALLNGGASLEAKDRTGRTALDWAKHEGRFDIVTHVHDNHRESVARLKSSSTLSGEKGQLLIKAAKRGDVSKVDELLDSGADYEAKNDDGMSALMCACLKGHLYVVETLLKAGADVDAKDVNFTTALMFAARGGHHEVCEALFRAGAEIDATNTNGKTALIFAAEKGRAEVVDLLLREKPRINIKDVEGKTAMDWARAEKHSQIIEMLEEATARTAHHSYSESFMMEETLERRPSLISPSNASAVDYDPMDDVNNIVDRIGDTELMHSRIFILGEGRAGKTALQRSFEGQAYSETSSTVGVNSSTFELYTTVLETGGKDWKVYDDAKGQLDDRIAREAVKQARLDAVTTPQLRAAEQVKAAQHERKSALDSIVEIQDMMESMVPASQRSPGKNLSSIHLLFDHSPTHGSPLSTPAVSRVNSGLSHIDVHHSNRHHDPLASPPVTPIRHLSSGSFIKRKLQNSEILPSVKNVVPSLETSELEDSFDMSGIKSPILTVHTQLKATPRSRPKSIFDVKDKLNADLIRKYYKDEVDPLKVSLWDFGGQDVFSTMHHLFLTPFGVYTVVFNMEWLLGSAKAEVREEALNTLRFWLNSVAAHTTRPGREECAPVILVGTHKDVVQSPADHEEISKLLFREFRGSAAWKSVLVLRDGQVSTGRGILWFYPVDNKLGKKDPIVIAVMNCAEQCMIEEDYIRKKVPLSWVQVIDQLQAETREAMSMTELETLCAQCGMPSSSSVTLHQEAQYLARFFAGLGMIMYHREPSLRNIVVLRPAKFLVEPATRFLCDFEIHVLDVHDIAKRKKPGLWDLLSNRGILDRELLPILWRDYKNHLELENLMVKYGLMIPIISESSASKRISQNYLVPAILPDRGEVHQGILGLELTCFLVFATPEKMASWDKKGHLELETARREGFCPSGVFERIAGKAVASSQATLGGSVEAMELSRREVEVCYGKHRFVLQNLSHLGLVRVLILVKSSRVVVPTLLEQVRGVLAECIPNLQVEVAIPSDGGTNKSGYAGTGYAVLLGGSGGLEAMDEKGEGMKVEKRVTLDPAQLSERFVLWLPPKGRRMNYDIFVSYRWKPLDSELASSLFLLLSKEIIGLRAVEVFLDRNRLEVGQNFKDEFGAALCASTVAVPLVSDGTMVNMQTLRAHSEVDNVLLEWTIILELQRLGKLKAVLPIILGPLSQTEGASLVDASAKPMSSFFLSATKLDASGQPVPCSPVELLSDDINEKVCDKAAAIMRQNSIEPTPMLRKRSIKSIVSGIIECLGVLAWEVVPQAADPLNTSILHSQVRFKQRLFTHVAKTAMSTLNNCTDAAYKVKGRFAHVARQAIAKLHEDPNAFEPQPDLAGRRRRRHKAAPEQTSVSRVSSGGSLNGEARQEQITVSKTGSQHQLDLDSVKTEFVMENSDAGRKDSDFKEKRDSVENPDAEPMQRIQALEGECQRLKMQVDAAKGETKLELQRERERGFAVLTAARKKAEAELQAERERTRVAEGQARKAAQDAAALRAKIQSMQPASQCCVIA